MLKPYGIDSVMTSTMFLTVIFGLVTIYKISCD